LGDDVVHGPQVELHETEEAWNPEGQEVEQV
jgi:hypothetical protein